MNVKKMFVFLMILLLIYIGLGFVFKRKEHTNEIHYTIEKENISLEVEEIVNSRSKKEDNYFFAVHVQDKLFTFKLSDHSKDNYKIKDIDYYEDTEYTCIAPIFKGIEKRQILCMKEEILYPYPSIKGENKEVDNFAASLDYDVTSYVDDTSNSFKKGTLTIYPNNLLSNHYIAFENYKGLTLINVKELYKNIELFTNDIYTRNMSLFKDNYYLTADYNQKYNFNEFFLVNIKTGKRETIISQNALSLDGYAMGAVENKMYFYDKSTKKQYAVSYKNKKISQIGNENQGIQIYQNDAFETKKSYEAYQNKLTFYEEKIIEEDKEFDRIDRVGDEKTGTYYYYKRDGKSYHVYSASTLYPTSYMYLFDTTNIDNIVYEDNFIYYINGNRLCYYSLDTGSKTVLFNTELTYNKSLKFGMFVS